VFADATTATTTTTPRDDPSKNTTTTTTTTDKSSPNRRRPSDGIFRQSPAATTHVIDDNQKKKKKKQQQQQHRHSWLYSMLSPHSHQPQAEIFKRFIATVILTDMILFIMSTDPRCISFFLNTNNNDNDDSEAFFHIAEGVVSGIFLVEYVARLTVITEQTRYAYHPIYGRLRYATTTFAGWIDLLATAPYFLEIGTGWNMPRVTILRVFRLFRILRTQSYMRAWDAVYRVVYYNSQILQVSALLCLFLVLTMAVLLYYFRPSDDDMTTNDPNFDSMASTLYMSALILTGQGGPDGPLPIQTKLVVVLTSIVSVAFYSVPASMLVWGFEAEAERMAKRERRRQKKKMQDRQDNCWTTTTTSSSSSSSSSAGTTDEEYFRTIAGEESESDAEKETPWMKQVRAAFEKADANMDGTLTIREATELLTNYTVQNNDNNDDRIQSTAALTARIDSLEATIRAQNDKLDQVMAVLRSKF
jgi:voltage-gated potassium channel